MTTLPTTALAKTRFQPTLIAPDTYLLHDHEGEGKAPVSVAVNSMVILAREPVVVDTGAAEHRDRFFADLFGLVAPEDVRWVFVSHDDVDHTGNLNELMALCPNATVVVNWFITERMGASLAVHPARQRWVDDGGSFDVGDRTLQAIRPPVYDSPTTRGLYDPTTGAYWSSDAFATPMLTPSRDVSTYDAGFWTEGMAMFNHFVSPWLSIVDDAAFQRTVDRVAALAPSVIAGCHTPAIAGHQVAAAIAATRATPSMPVPPQPDQAVLEQIQATLAPVGVG